jgi:hypothetical protein
VVDFAAGRGRDRTGGRRTGAAVVGSVLALDVTGAVAAATRTG